MHPPASANRPSPAGSTRQHGLTLVELMIVVVLVAIFASLAGPSFRQLVARQRVHSAASAITEALWVARAEALKRNRDVGFVFADAASEWSVPDPGGSATPLLTQPAHRSVSSTTESGAAVQFTFNAYGRLSSGMGWIELSDVAAGVYRCLNVKTTGRATSTEGKCA
jgi:type IV fimbrial biogenesis protein FimT